ncbi:lysozyme [Bacteroides salyersiae]|uniref:lysozyme n=1 Tax=Bacteroides salyersiae TaxID=291644 RepID=UPI0013ECD6C3
MNRKVILLCPLLLLIQDSFQIGRKECIVDLHKTTDFQQPEIDLFETAVACIKKYEGWHSREHFPYVGYGHRLLKGEAFDHRISEKFADLLLRKDLRIKCGVFRDFGRDSLILGTLAYNVGEYRLLGFGKKLKSNLIRKLEKGNRDIYDDYISFCHHKGKVVPSIKKRRMEEYRLLFNCKYINNKNYD